ncbi:hypothetical protein H634G_08095 [Metarhizium anisopliae BRIP 53293]|uniref:Uncharacterized protein n=1 Tax=Metarhizium anisopliae BRIP 53293 TaxID=1291518 RepID=A0A0D9NR30_METAN|nr:hypothetical protein H634G_08095 [Metarhizium anisopliae BRIP 53293]KJK86206.1 hypothetical protein H633G_09962 [Metarhizium anisopliae BRIP 53284]
MSSLTRGPLFQEFDRIRLPALIPMNVFQNNALYWVAFTLGFLEGAMGQDWSNVKEEKTHGAFLDLRIIIRGGLKRLGPSCAGIIDNMDDIREEKSQPTPATRQEKEVIAAKKREKLDKESNFAVKVNSRPSTPASASASS